MREGNDAGAGWWRGSRQGALGSACLVLLAACGRAPEPATAESAPALVETAPQAQGDGAPADIIPPESDTSLPLAVYRAAGVPEVAQRWSVADYERCLHVFADMLRSGRADLPRQGSARSGALFARLISPDNFVLPLTSSPIEPARELQRYLDVFPGLLRVYSPANDGVDFSREQASLSVALLELLKSALTESRRLASQDPSWSEQYDRQKAVTVGVVRALGVMLAEETRYPEPLRQRLESALARLAPDLEPHLDPESARLVQATAHGTTR